MLKDLCKSGLLVGTLLASSSAEGMPPGNYNKVFGDKIESKAASVNIEPEDRIAYECDKVAKETFAEVMDQVMSQEFIIGSHKQTAPRLAELSRRDCMITEVAEYCAITGDMKYTEVINAFGFESEFTVSKATQIAEEAEKLCTDEMNVNLGIL